MKNLIKKVCSEAQAIGKAIFWTFYGPNSRSEVRYSQTEGRE